MPKMASVSSGELLGVMPLTPRSQPSKDVVQDISNSNNSKQPSIGLVLWGKVRSRIGDIAAMELSEVQKEMKEKDTSNRVNAEILQSVVKHAKLHSKETARQQERMKRLLGLVHSVRFLPDSPARRVWDTVLLLITVYYTVVWPLYLILSKELELTQVAIEIVLSLIQIVHLFIELNTARIEPSGDLVECRLAIAQSYLKSTLIPDVISTLPIDLILWKLGHDGEWYFHVVRALRLFSIARISSGIYRQTDIAMTPGYVRFHFHYVPLLRFCVYFFFGLHFLICVHLYLTVVQQRDVSTQLPGSFSVDDSPSYSYSLYWVWNLLTTSPAPLPINSTYQRWYAVLCMCLSLLVQAVVVGKITIMLLQSNIKHQNQERMRQTLDIMHHFKIPFSLQQEVLSFQYHMLKNDARMTFQETLGNLPPMMQEELSIYVKIDMIEKVPMLSKASRDGKYKMAQALQQLLVEPDVNIIEEGEQGSEMFFMFHGYADVIVGGDQVISVIRKGDFFGEAGLLKKQRRTTTVRTLTYCDMFRLDKSDFDAIVAENPDLRHRVDQEMRKRASSHPRISVVIDRCDAQSSHGRSRGSMATNFQSSSSVMEPNAPNVGISEHAVSEGNSTDEADTPETRDESVSFAGAEDINKEAPRHLSVPDRVLQAPQQELPERQRSVELSEPSKLRPLETGQMQDDEMAWLRRGFFELQEEVRRLKALGAEPHTADDEETHKKNATRAKVYVKPKYVEKALEKATSKTLVQTTSPTNAHCSSDGSSAAVNNNVAALISKLLESDQRSRESFREFEATVSNKLAELRDEVDSLRFQMQHQRHRQSDTWVPNVLQPGIFQPRESFRSNAGKRHTVHVETHNDAFKKG